jgi:outer membrane protein OmpA-like peptidoglycan-associated protein
MEYAPKREMLGMLFYHKELPAADRAVEAARAAGKANQCPDEFNAVAKLRDDAFTTYWACRTEEAIAMSNQAVSRANALCPVKVAAPQPPVPAPAPAPVPPPPPPPPTVSITAAPASIVQGKCSTLTWTSANAASASIDQGLGSVSPSGSREVCPPATMQYSIAAVGAGGSRTASTAVTVTPPPPKVVERLTVRVNFDLDKAIIRPPDDAELQRAVAFVKKYPGYKLSIEGHTDSLASEEYNQGLSLRRATAVRDYLVKSGVSEVSRMTVVGRGESNPIADNGTPEGRFQNRRVEILILSE